MMIIIRLFITQRLDTNGELYAKGSIFDIDGDGHADRILQDSSSSSTWDVQYNTGLDFQNATSWSNISTNPSACIREVNEDEETIVDIGDMNGDGFIDRILKTATNTWYVQLNDGDSFDTPTAWSGVAGGSGLDAIRRTGTSGSDKYTDIDLFDINGDGLPDRVCLLSTSDTTWSVQLNNGSGFDSSITWGTVEDTNSCGKWIRFIQAGDKLKTDIFDVNGDGLPDRVFRSGTDEWKVQYNNGSGFEESEVWEDSIEDVGSSNREYINYGNSGSGKVSTEVDIIDLNGDGLFDRILQEYGESDTWVVQYNNGSGLEATEEFVNVSTAISGWIKEVDTDDTVQTVEIDLFDI